MNEGGREPRAQTRGTDPHHMECGGHRLVHHKAARLRKPKGREGGREGGRQGGREGGREGVRDAIVPFHTQRFGSQPDTTRPDVRTDRKKGVKEEERNNERKEGNIER